MTLTTDALEAPLEDAPPAGAGSDGGGPGANPASSASTLRTAIAVALPTIAAAVMVGGIFSGISPRIYGAIGGLLGIALAVALRQVRRPAAGYALAAAGLFAIGVAMVVPSGLTAVTHIRALATEATSAGAKLRPPVPFSPGWQAIVGWIMGLIGFITAWVALVLRRPALAILLPLPLAAVAGISVPHSAQAVSGVVVLVLFAVALGMLSTAEAMTTLDERPPRGYEVRRAIRALPVIAAVSILLALLLKADFLFPKPAIDPAQQAQRPRAVPLSKVPDRTLFSVESSITGPWRIGSLDVYDGHDWRLPPFAENKLQRVPRSGIVDSQLTGAVRADFTVVGLSGAVLPGLPNTVGIVASGPRLVYDGRNGNIRTAEGQIRKGLHYSVTSAGLPSIDDLEHVTAAVPKDVRPFTKIPAPPPAVTDLIGQAPKDSKWQEFDYLRNYVLDNVTATGTGVPTSIDGARVQDMLAGSKQASPFELVAAQAMLARWVGIPSRIGYGFDGGDQVQNHIEVHPRNGASFVEVYFPGYKWLPVIGTPKKAKPTVGGDKGQQQFDPSILPSDDISIKVYAFQATPPASVALAQLRQTVFIGLPILIGLLALYVLFPVAAKARRRQQRRRTAAAEGDRARLGLAYAEWRDLATDFGFDHPTDTPLMFLSRFSPDEEHRQLAWLVTRASWGDLRASVTPELAAAAEVLSRSLRRRLRREQPATLRVVAALSRLSLRHPYDPSTLAVSDAAA